MLSPFGDDRNFNKIRPPYSTVVPELQLRSPSYNPPGELHEVNMVTRPAAINLNPRYSMWPALASAQLQRALHQRPCRISN
jgi:hypothetical protein